MKGTVLIDRDGTLIIEKNYLSKVDEVELINKAGLAIANLNKSEFNVFVVSNQSGIGRGFFNEKDLCEIHKKIDEILNIHGAKIDGYYHCPHSPNETQKCDCRKPNIGLFKKIKETRKIHPSNIWMIGDKTSDIDFAINANIKPILVRTGYGSKVINFKGPVMQSIYEASNFIINENI